MSKSSDEIISAAQDLTAHRRAWRDLRVIHNETVIFCITSDLKAALNQAALARGIPLSRLCNALLSAIARDDLFKAVLDDEAKR